MLLEKISNDDDLAMAQERIDELLELSPDKGSAAWKELDALSEMVEEFEEARELGEGDEE